MEGRDFSSNQTLLRSSKSRIIVVPSIIRHIMLTTDWATSERRDPVRCIFLCLDCMPVRHISDLYGAGDRPYSARCAGNRCRGVLSVVCLATEDWLLIIPLMGRISGRRRNVRKNRQPFCGHRLISLNVAFSRQNLPCVRE